MFGTLRQLFSTKKRTEQSVNAAQEESPREVALEGNPPFPLRDHLSFYNGLPFLDWEAARPWIDASSSDALQGQAWNACERAWLLHMRDALGDTFRLDELGDAALVSSLEPRLAQATLEFMQRTSRRIAKVLDGITEVQEWGKDILIVFDDQDSYYNYVSHYYQEDGEYSLSGGMCLVRDCVHFVIVKDELHSIEPVIAHEMTHGMLTHLSLPLWLDEGLAVNTEQRICPKRLDYHRLNEFKIKRAQFWGENEIQEFWSGDSFSRPDEGNELSYDLARMMVEQMAQDWDSFRQFVLAAEATDAGAKAAQAYLHIDLGDFVTSLLDRPASDAWVPNPEKWRKINSA